MHVCRYVVHLYFACSGICNMSLYHSALFIDVHSLFNICLWWFQQQVIMYMKHPIRFKDTAMPCPVQFHINEHVPVKRWHSWLCLFCTLVIYKSSSLKSLISEIYRVPLCSPCCFPLPSCVVRRECSPGWCLPHVGAMLTSLGTASECQDQMSHTWNCTMKRPCWSMLCILCLLVVGSAYVVIISMVMQWYDCITIVCHRCATYSIRAH